MIYINKKKCLYFISILVLVVITFLLLPKNKGNETTAKLKATVINSKTDLLTVQDENNIIYTFNVNSNNYKTGDNLIIEYTGLLNKNTEKQTNNTLINIRPVSQDEMDIAKKPRNSMFSQFDTLANDKLKTMTLDEKIGQILLVRYPDDNFIDAIKTYKVGGFVFFEKDFKDKTTTDVQTMINNLQKSTKIPLLTAVDEEGGDVVRVSSNKNLSSKEFLSPRDLYLEGGFNLISTDTKEKSTLLENLGLNVNLAPVVDVSTNSTDYMYNRTLGEGPELTSTYAKTVIEASKGSKVSYVLKHFPGYGNNEDTHNGKVIDTRSFADIEKNDLPPFKVGIESGAEAILVSHNIVEDIDKDNAASLSASVHNLLRNDLNFTGIIMTDDLSMQAISTIEKPTTKALLAGNDILIVTDYEKSFNEIKASVDDGTISEEFIDNIVRRILSWKYSKGLMLQNQK